MTSMPLFLKLAAQVEITALAAGAGPPENRMATFLKLCSDRVGCESGADSAIENSEFMFELDSVFAGSPKPNTRLSVVLQQVLAEEGLEVPDSVPPDDAPPEDLSNWLRRLSAGSCPFPVQATEYRLRPLQRQAL